MIKIYKWGYDKRRLAESRKDEVDKFNEQLFQQYPKLRDSIVDADHNELVDQILDSIRTQPVSFEEGK